MSEISEEIFYSSIRSVKKLKKEIEKLKIDRNEECSELLKKLLKVQRKYKDKLFELDNERKVNVKIVTNNWSKFVKEKQINFEGDGVVKVTRYDFKIENKLEITKLLMLMKRMDAIEFVKPKIRELIKIGSIPEEYITKIDQSFIKFMKVEQNGK